VWYNASQRLSTYTYSYNRYENDIIYGDDNISVTVDPETLGITFFSIDYCDGEFVSPEKAISASKALDYYWTQLTPDPIYMVSSNYGEGKLTVYTGYGATKEPLDLVKVYRFDRHLYIDAFDGTLLNYSGRPYTYSEIEYFDGKGFEDIGNTPYAEAISKLCDMDFIKDAAKYRPNSHITVGDFMEMIRPLNTSYYRTKVINSDNEEYDPKAEITREEAAKIVIESMGYGEVAALSGIFKCSFTDADALTEGYIGYAAIAQALGLLDSFGDTMQPRNMLTRGEAAQIVYDYLLRLNK